MDQSAAPSIVDSESEALVNVQPAMEYDLEKAAAFKAALEAQQNLPLAVVAGLGAAVLGAAIWAAITVTTGYKIGWVAVGVGFLVGIAVRKFGKGISKPFALTGAICALLGCALGNFLSVCGFVSILQSEPFSVVVLSVLSEPAMAVELMVATASPMDFLFYAIAMYEGYKFSFREITAEELTALTKPAEATA